MKFNTTNLLKQYAECRQRIAGAIVAALQHAAPEVDKHFPPLPFEGDGLGPGPKQPTRPISGVGLYIDPENFYLSLRNDNEKWGDVAVADYPENWEFEVGDGANPAPEVTRCLAWITEWVDAWGQQYESSDSLHDALRHLLNLAAAEAMFDSRVCDELQRQSIEAIPYCDVASGVHFFRYVVRASDYRLTINYCDLVVALQFTSQIGSGEVLRRLRAEQKEADGGRQLAINYLGYDGDLHIGQLSGFLSWLLKNKK
jgi:hypothetical protein